MIVGDEVKYIGYAASVGEKNIMDAIQFCLAEGFTAVEINTNIPCFLPENYSQEERVKIKDFAQAKGIKLSLHGPEDMTLLMLHKVVAEATMQRYQDLIDFGTDIGAENMTIHIGNSVNFTMTDGSVFMDEEEKEIFETVLKKHLLFLAEYSKGKINICIENTGRFTANFIQKVIRELIANENLYLTWDIGHSYFNKYQEWDFFMEHKDKIKTCHVHDHTEKSDHQIIGVGKLDFLKHFAELKGKDITYIIEVRPRDKAVEAYKEMKKLILY